MKMLLNGLALALLIQASPTIAQVNTRVVNHGDLDLSQSQGRAVLEQRIRTAVKQACGGPGFRDLKDLRERRDCIGHASAKAKADMARAIRKRWAIQVAKAATPQR